MLDREAEQLALVGSVMPVAATATAMLCTEIILPITPAAEFTDAVRIGIETERVGGDHLQIAEQRVCRVSLPVRNTPSHPRTALKNGNGTPVPASARPSVDVMPE